MCTQDHGGNIPQKFQPGYQPSSVVEYHQSGRNEKDLTLDDVKLSPEIQKGVNDGCYTPEQIVTLKQQRLEAVKSIAEGEKAFRQSHGSEAGTSNTVSSSSHPPVSSLSSSSGAHGLVASASTLGQPEIRLFPECSFACCHNCRPTYRDRTWLNLDDILASDAPVPPIDFAKDNRPISNADVLRKMDPFRKPRQPYLQTFEDMGLSAPGSSHQNSSGWSRNPRAYHDEIQEIASNLEPQEDASESEGFRRGVRRAFRQMLMSRRRSSTKSRTRGRSIRKVRQELEDTEEFDIGLYHELSDAVLAEASTVPLPGHDGMDGLDNSNGEIEVENGVAVTEEGVDLGSADIIMQV